MTPFNTIYRVTWFLDLAVRAWVVGDYPYMEDLIYHAK